MAIEVRNADDTLVFQQTFPDQSFAFAEMRQYLTAWRVVLTTPVASYWVVTRASTRDGGTAVNWNERAARISIVDGIVSVDRTKQVGVSRFSGGVTHAHHSADSWNNPTAVRSAQQLLRSSMVYANQPVMGAGPGNPWPDPAVTDPAQWNWDSLDERVNLIRSTNSVGVLTLWGAPTWMVDPNWSGGTDWSKIDWPPLPEHEADFARLSEQIAQRYPDIRYFQVWAELKGMWDIGNNRWDYPRYTRLYNRVWDAVKRVRPDAQIGGPYVYIDSRPSSSAWSSSTLRGPYGVVDQRSLDVLTYWLANKHGGDFVTIDGSSYDNAPLDPFAATRKFADVTEWIRRSVGRTLPVWWAEWYVTSWNATNLETFDHDLQNALMADALSNMISSGASVALRWQGQGVASDGYEGDQGSLWSDTRVAGGGQPFPFYLTARTIHDDFGPGTPLFQVRSSSPDVEVLASSSRTLLINKRPTPTVVAIGTRVVTLKAHEVRVL